MSSKSTTCWGEHVGPVERRARARRHPRFLPGNLPARGDGYRPSHASPWNEYRLYSVRRRGSRRRSLCAGSPIRLPIPVLRGSKPRRAARNDARLARSTRPHLRPNGASATRHEVLSGLRAFKHRNGARSKVRGLAGALQRASVDLAGAGGGRSRSSRHVRPSQAWIGGETQRVRARGRSCVDHPEHRLLLLIWSIASWCRMTVRVARGPGIRCRCRSPSHDPAADPQGKILMLPGDHSDPDRFVLDVETEHRQSALDAASEGADWVIQLDTDELLPSPSAFAAQLALAEQRGADALEFPARIIYARTPSGRFLEQCGRLWTAQSAYPGPVAVRAGTRLSHARQAAGSPMHRVDVAPWNTDPAHPRECDSPCRHQPGPRDPAYELGADGGADGREATGVGLRRRRQVGCRTAALAMARLITRGRPRSGLRWRGTRSDASGSPRSRHSLESSRRPSRVNQRRPRVGLSREVRQDHGRPREAGDRTAHSRCRRCHPRPDATRGGDGHHDPASRASPRQPPLCVAARTPRRPGGTPTLALARPRCNRGSPCSPRSASSRSDGTPFASAIGGSGMTSGSTSDSASTSRPTTWTHSFAQRSRRTSSPTTRGHS